jgi:hypothetical protein
LKPCSYAFALVLLLGAAFAKDKAMANYPSTVVVKSASIWEGTGIVINGVSVPTQHCSMIIYDDQTVYTVSSSGGGCRQFPSGAQLSARFYSGVLGLTAEFAWTGNKGKVKTTKYVVNSQTAR